MTSETIQISIEDVPVPVTPSGLRRLWGRFTSNASKPAKIVGLVPGRNEEARIAYCLSALSKVTDAIVFLDDCSDDNTVSVVESIAAECQVEKIITKSSWYRDEPGDRNALLQVGRAIGGTHFVVIDADEMLTGNCLVEDQLRVRILEMKPREQLSLHWIQLWRSLEEYRTDVGSKWTDNYKRCIFCDDGRALYRSDFIHTSRIPKLKGRRYRLDNLNLGLLHFQFVNWDNLILKQRWYRCLERVRDPQKSIDAINAKYAKSVDEAGLVVSDCPAVWFERYDKGDLVSFVQRDEWRDEQIRAWATEHGEAFFTGLDA